MVISFSVKEARDQLLNEGIVYTYRWTRRAFFRKGLGSKEATWANAKRGTKRIADVWIEEVGQISETDLDPYVSKSGFRDLILWQNKIVVMGSPANLEDGWLYKVEVRKEPA